MKLTDVLVSVAGVAMFPLVFVASVLAAVNHPLALPVIAVAFVAFVYFLRRV